MYSRDYRLARPATSRLMDMLAEGLLSHEAVVEMCLGAMSEQEVAYMMDANELSERFEEELEEPEYDGQPDEAQEWHDFDPDC